MWSCPLDLPEPARLELLACLPAAERADAERRTDPLDRRRLLATRAWRRQPQTIAVSDGALGVTYADLDRRSDQTAEPLSAVGKPSAQRVIDALRALKAGTPLRLRGTAGQLVEITHSAARNVATALAAELGVTPADTILVLPQALDRDPVSALWMGLIAGAQIVLAPAEAAGDGARLRRLIRAKEITFLQASPGEWHSLIETGLRSIRGLRALSGGGQGEPLSRELAARILDRCRALWSGYSAGETSGFATVGRVESARPVTISRPLANLRAHVVDAHGRSVAVGVPGELLIAGEGVAAGNLDADDRGNGFIADPFAPGRAFLTGQRVRRRTDGQLKLAPGP